MKVILTEDIRSVGKKGETVNVSDGYARNFILPKKLGVEATAVNLNNLKLKNENDVKIERENKAAAQELAVKLKESPVVIKVKTGAGGKLFGAIASKEIAAALEKQTGLEVDKKKILLDEPIKELGMHVIKARLYRDVTAEITLNVVQE